MHDGKAKMAFYDPKKPDSGKLYVYAWELYDKIDMSVRADGTQGITSSSVNRPLNAPRGGLVTGPTPPQTANMPKNTSDKALPSPRTNQPAKPMSTIPQRSNPFAVARTKRMVKRPMRRPSMFSKTKPPGSPPMMRQKTPRP